MSLCVCVCLCMCVSERERARESERERESACVCVCVCVRRVLKYDSEMTALNDELVTVTEQAPDYPPPHPPCVCVCG